MLGTYVEVSIQADLPFEVIADLSKKAFETIESVQDALSFHNSQSELSEINKLAHIRPLKMSKHMTNVMHFSLTLSEQSKGIFDPTVAPELIKQKLLPDHYHNAKSVHSSWENIELEKDTIHFQKPTLIDLGGIAKGYAVDKAYQTIRSHHAAKQKNSVIRVVINAGGDLIDSSWKNQKVDLRHPHTAHPYKKIQMQNLAMATTSYCYQGVGKNPLKDPLSRKPINLKGNVTIFADQCIVADSLTKIYAIDPDSLIHQTYNALPVMNQ